MASRANNAYGLNDRQWRFVQEYLIDLNATEAYARAGYKSRGDTGSVAASQLLSNVKVAKAVQIEKARLAMKSELRQEKVLEELHILAHSDVTHYQIDPEGQVQLAPGAPPNAMRAVSSIRRKITATDVGINVEVVLQLWNKAAALKMAGDHLGIFEQSAVKSIEIQEALNTRQQALQGLRDQMAQIRARHVQGEKVLP